MSSDLIELVDVQGLPKQWQQMLSDSGITDQDQASHPQAVVDIVAFYQVRLCLRNTRNEH